MKKLRFSYSSNSKKGFEFTLQNVVLIILLLATIALMITFFPHIKNGILSIIGKK